MQNIILAFMLHNKYSIDINYFRHKTNKVSDMITYWGISISQLTCNVLI